MRRLLFERHDTSEFVSDEVCRLAPNARQLMKLVRLRAELLDGHDALIAQGCPCHERQAQAWNVSRPGIPRISRHLPHLLIVFIQVRVRDAGQLPMLTILNGRPVSLFPLATVAQDPLFQKGGSAQLGNDTAGSRNGSVL
jgi:hypothetical protein